MGERLFWIDETEEGSEEFESSHGSDDSSSSSKKLRLSPDLATPQPQEGIHAETSPEGSSSSPLGLTLTKTPSFLSLLRDKLSKGKKQQHSSHSPKPKSADHDSKSQSMSSEKLKASNFPVMMLQIGSWQRISRHQGELVAKLYYAKRKLVWEVLDRALKSKIEMQWSDIIAIRAVMPDDQPGTLEIELNRPPLFYRESNPQPRKHTLWHQTNDFTGGQAPTFRRHCVRFPPGVLDRHYHKLLQCDERLYALSHKPFPSCESPYFDWNMGRVPQLSLNFSGSGYSQHAQYPYETYPVNARPPPSSLGLITNSTIPGMALTLGDGGRHSHYANQEEINWANLNHQGMPLIPSGSQNLHYQSPQPNVSLLPALSSGDGTLNATVGPAYAFLESTAVNPNYNAYHQYSTTDQVRNNPSPFTDHGLYSDHASWPFASQESADGTHVDQNVDNSLPPFPGIFRF